MPSEPDNRMDDLLKAYAKKRREEAGASMQIHPATRRLLQAEAAKLRPKGQDRKESWFSALLGFSPRYASAAAALVLVGVGAWSFFHFGQPPEQMALVDAEAEPAAPRPEPAPALAGAEKKERGGRQFREADGGEQELRLRLARAPIPAEPQPVPREEAGVQFKVIADESKTKRTGVELAANESLQKNLAPAKPASVTAQAATPPPPPITAPAPAREGSASRQLASTDAKDQVALKGAQTLNDNYARLPQSPPGAAGANAQNIGLSYPADANALARQNRPVPPPQSVPTTTPQGPVGGFSSLASQQAPTAASPNRFYSQQGPVAQTTRNLVSSRNRFSQVPSVGRTVSLQQADRANAPVLAEFDFEQTGQRVRVVDADGSVYDGQIEDAAKANFDNNAKDVARRDFPSNVEQRKVGDKPAALAENAGADAPAWNFRASGTNRTLQQPVTINGVLYTGSTNFSGQAPAVRGAVQQTSQQLGNTAPPTVQRIQGRVQVGTGAETPLDAVRR